MKVQNKVIVVTGGGSGMGRELVLNLLAKGARVAAVDVNEATLRETAQLSENNNVRLSLHIVNITDKDAVASLPEQVISKHGTVDGLINNAGIIQPFVRVNELDYAAIERVMNVNFYGTLYMTKAFLPHLLTRPEAHIVNVSSMGGSAGSRAKHLRGLQGSRQIINRRAALGAAHHQCEGHGCVSRRRWHEYCGKFGSWNQWSGYRRHRRTKFLQASRAEQSR